MNLSLIDTLVILRQLKSNKFESISVLQKGIGSQRHVEMKGLRLCLFDEIAIEVFRFIDDLLFVY